MSGVARGFLKYTPVNAVGVKTFGVTRRLSVDDVFPVVHPPLTPLLAPQLTGPLFYCSGHFCESNGVNRRDSRSRIGRETFSVKVPETSLTESIRIRSDRFCFPSESEAVLLCISRLSLFFFLAAPAAATVTHPI